MMSYKNIKMKTQLTEGLLNLRKYNRGDMNK